MKDKRKIISIVAAGLLVLIVVVVIVLSRKSGSLLDGLDAYTDTETTEVVEELDESESDDSGEDVSSNSTSVGDIEVDPSYSVSETTTALTDYELLHPDIGWSDGELSQDEYDILVQSAVYVYEQSLNADGDYTVGLLELTAEDLAEFEYPVYYYTEPYGVLVFNTHLSIIDNSTNKIKDSLVTIRIHYNMNVIELVE